MRRIDLTCLTLVLLVFLVEGGIRSDASTNPRFVVRNGKTLVCWVRFSETMSGDCGTESYDAVFTGKILAFSPVPTSNGRHPSEIPGATNPSDVRLTVEPKEVFKGHPGQKIQILAEQGKCFDEMHAGDDWLFFGKKGEKKGGLEIWYVSSNPSGPVEQRWEYVERLRRLAHGDGLGFIAGEVDFPSDDSSLIYHSGPQANHPLLFESEDGKQRFSVATDAQGKFELGPVAPGFYRIDADTDPQFRSARALLDGALVDANGCSLRRIELEINSEISGRVILPEGYQYKKSDIGNYFPLFYVDVDTPDGKQVGGTSIGDGLQFAVRGLKPGKYVVQLVNFSGEDGSKSLSLPPA